MSSSMLLTAAVLCTLHLQETHSTQISSKRDFAVVAYLPEWRYEGANWDTILGTVTHLILFSVEVLPSGELSALDRIPRSALLTEVRTLRP